MSRTNLSRLISPKSIAVVGNRGANFAIRESKKLGYNHKIWAIHPTLDFLEGIKCYKDIKDLPEAPDATFIAVNAESAIAIVADLKSIGGGGAVLYASGFGELGEKGIKRNQRLEEAADGMPLIGPNCYGFINSLDGVALWPDVHGCEPVLSGVAIITQSGNIGLNITMQSIGLPIAYMFTLGNQTNTNIADIINAMLDDNRVNAIGLHIEGISDIKSFDVAARRALDKKIPIVAIKSGRTDVSAKIALSHTSSMTGLDQLFNVFFERLGIARVDTVPEFLETLKLLSILGTIDHNGVASMSCSGGEAGMMADLIDGLDITFPSLDDLHKDRVKLALNDYVEVDNPLDYHTFIWGDRKRTSKCFKQMISGNFAATMLLLDWPRTQESEQKDWDLTLLALSDAISGTREKTIVLASIADCMPKRIIKECQKYGIAPMIGLDICLKALNHSYRIGLAFQKSSMQSIEILRSLSHPSKISTLTEFEGKKLLKKYGIPVPDGKIISSTSEALIAAEKIHYPITLKVSDVELVHKTELGAVMLNINDPLALEKACQDLFKIGSSLLIEKMVQDSVAELIIGVGLDPIFGKYIIIGSGGILVELFKESIPLLFPVNRKDVSLALSKLKAFPLINGYRGNPQGDVEMIIDCVMATVKLVSENDIDELDINPLLVLKRGSGVIAVDTLIKLNLG
ncbi:acetate--CoA ligase family protein [Candidatus Pseudothioglobus sp. Uisw_041]|jgi:acetyl-CoA synthetase|uniref:acetate--CoA ligase family protein n=1 Tax=Candidatus Pseudothioglobus sp. Uisw_041 TaxID=3230996 RepID=UPI00236E13D1|nr:acetate--CoA ligase family protein [Candidatus Thioglobus sp.]